MRKTMISRDVERTSQKDRELEELLCLAYLFTHLSSDGNLGESDDLLADNVELFSGLFVN